MKSFIISTILFLLVVPNLANAETRTYINSDDITVISSITDVGSGVTEMSFSVDGGTTWTDPEPFASTKSLTLPILKEGETCILARFKDGAGNWTPIITPFVACAWVDTTAPVGTIKINGVVIEITIQ